MHCKTIGAVILLLTVALCAAVPIDRKDGVEGRIVGGSKTTINQHPWQVSVQRSGVHFCGGSLLSSTIVVTAAHCLLKVTVPTLRIRAGSSYRAYGGTVVAAAAFKVHESYNDSSKANDIGVIRLKSALTLSSSIKTIALATATPAHGAAASCSGWGATQFEGYFASQLSYIDTQIVGRSQCASSSYGYGSKIGATMLCAAASNKDACQGDSGGPLVVGSKLVGIVSWGNNCAQAYYPGVYADVAVLRNWVLQAMKTV